MARRVSWLIVLVLAAALPARAEKKPVPAPGEASANVSSTYEDLYARYLAAARSMTPPTATVRPIDWMVDLGTDPRARRVNDLLTIRVVENITAVGSADSQLDKASDGHASVSNLFGLENHLPDWIDPTNLVNTASDTKFKGSGTTSRSGELTATITARVVEVLPNGDLLLEAAREIAINGDRQIVVLTGVARQADIDRRNVIRSTQIGQLRIQYFGRGLIKDNLKPGWLIRIMNKMF